MYIYLVRRRRKKRRDAVASPAVYVNPDAQSRQVHDACKRLPPWQSKREFSSNVMYAFRLQHPDLSRRVCRVSLILFVFLFALNHVEPSPTQSPDAFAKAETLPGTRRDSLFRFRREGDAASSPTTTAETMTPTTSATTSSPSPSKHAGPTDPPKRFAFASVDFPRVEIPFIIALWIFCASLAKIGM